MADENLLTSTFLLYRDYLDERNDKYELITRLSRDATMQSKKVIFGLLRKNIDKTQLVEEAQKSISKITEIFHKISKELKVNEAYQFMRAYKPGVEEFIEAATLMHYVESKSIVSFQMIKSSYFKFDDDTELMITPLDYMLGIGDLTGELMRLAVNSIANGDQKTLNEIYETLKIVFHQYSEFGGTNKDITQKLNVMRNSMKKIENACYKLKIRNLEGASLSEIFKDMTVDSF